MKIYFLGTGTSQGIPVIGSDHPVCLSKDSKDKRLRSSIWIQTENTSLVVDTGPDFRQQMLQSNCLHIDGILYSHEHADHTAGFDDIRPYCFKQGAINLYGLPRVIDSLKQRFDYAFKTENRYPGAPKVNATDITSEQSFKVNKTEIQPIHVMHGALPILGYRINQFAYLTDVKTIEPKELKKLNNLEVLVIDCLRLEQHNTHLCLDEALEFIKIIKPKKAYLTHISFKLGFHEVVEKNLPQNIFLAYDNLQITI